MHRKVESVVYEFSISEEFDNFLSECQNNNLIELKRKNKELFNSYFELFNTIYNKLSLNERKKFDFYREQKNIIYSIEFDYQYKAGYKNFIKLYMLSKLEKLEDLNNFSNIAIKDFRKKNFEYLEAIKAISKLDINDFLSHIDRDILNEYIRLDDELNNLIIKDLFLKGHIDCINLAIMLDVPIDKNNKYIKYFLPKIEY
ncbi:TPA: hypothetical protein KON86_002850 [Clostridioides difficile]|nr:hypothetical protein [Clostridioides difficile]MDW0092585.1 hypothetical protein [Clostridioides difficile]HBF4443218.1 hypothetical protein [Clostridioides difficile]HBG1420752.1 hypothetical protein [Clostridioides difficile]HBG5350114.1 hypothetical protein [Clostridioides difficile]